MTKRFWLGLIFFIFFLAVALWKLWVWIIWKILNSRKNEQAFNLVGKSRFIEIRGGSGKGKSWLLCHLFLNLKGVKFTNMPTPQGTYTLTRETCESHWVGKWAAPNRWYYFLDDVEKFNDWSQEKMKPAEFEEWQKYLISSGKLGGTYIWTNNGLDTPPPWKDNQNEKWIVKWYINFLDYSLLLVMKGWRPVLIPIDNKEIEGFYDPHWNISKQWNKNYLAEVAKRLKGTELNDLLEVVEDKYKAENEKYDREVLEAYIRERKREEEAYNIKKKAKEKWKKGVEKYGLNDKPLDKKRVEHFQKKEPKKPFGRDDKPKKGRPIKKGIRKEEISDGEKEKQNEYDSENESQE